MRKLLYDFCHFSTNFRHSAPPEEQGTAGAHALSLILKTARKPDPDPLYTDCYVDEWPRHNEGYDRVTKNCLNIL